MTASGYGEIFPFLLDYLTNVELNPDGKSARAEFGGLPLTSGLKIELEASVTDLTGAVGWDWQVTPPGDL